MKAWTKVLVILVLSFSVIFTSIGYAELTDSLSISGNIEFDIPSGLFITNIAQGSQSNIESESIINLGYSTTVECTLDKTSGNNITGSASYTVTVFNSTERVYAYRGLYYQTSSDTGFDSSYNGNDYVSETAANNKISITLDFDGDSSIIMPGEYLTFTVTYTVGSRLSSNTSWKTLVNLQFGINVDSAEEALDAVTDKFDNILNSSATYEQIIDKIDDKYDGTAWKATYFGNVAGSTSDDSVAINELFAGQLNMLINGIEQPVTVIIKRENIDGNTNTGDDYTATYNNQSTSGYGCEYTLYMTTDDLTTFNSYPTVYAMVYTCNRDADGNLGNWYMIGERYEGTAQVVGYIGGESSGSFDTGSWRSVAQTLSPSEGYTYSISANQSINTIVTADDANATAELQSLLNEAHAILVENKYAGTGMVALEELYGEMSEIYTLDADGSPVVNDVSRAVMIPFIKKMEDGLKQFELSELEAFARLSLTILSGSDGTADERSALSTAYNNAKDAGLFTDDGSTVTVNKDASYSELKLHVERLSAAIEPFYEK